MAVRTPSTLWAGRLSKPAFAVFDNPAVLYLPIEDPFFLSAEAFALRKGDPDSLNFLNNWIDLRTRDGWLKSRHEFWFKGRDWADQVAAN